MGLCLTLYVVRTILSRTFFFYFLNTILSGTVLSVFILLFGLFCLNSTYRLLLFVEIVELKMLMPISFNK